MSVRRTNARVPSRRSPTAWTARMPAPSAPILSGTAAEHPHHHHGPPPSPLFDALDTNHDGVISADEIANAPASLKALDQERAPARSSARTSGPRIPPPDQSTDPRHPKRRPHAPGPETSPGRALAFVLSTWPQACAPAGRRAVNGTSRDQPPPPARPAAGNHPARPSSSSTTWKPPASRPTGARSSRSPPCGFARAGWRARKRSLPTRDLDATHSLGHITRIHGRHGRARRQGAASTPRRWPGSRASSGIPAGLIAHNGHRFDSRFVEATCRRHGLARARCIPSIHCIFRGGCSARRGARDMGWTACSPVWPSDGRGRSGTTHGAT